VSSVGGIIASAGDVKSKDCSLDTLGSTVSTFSSDISTLERSDIRVRECNSSPFVFLEVLDSTGEQVNAKG
jgi:hypothetical protein